MVVIKIFMLYTLEIHLYNTQESLVYIITQHQLIYFCQFRTGTKKNYLWPLKWKTWGKIKNKIAARLYSLHDNRDRRGDGGRNNIIMDFMVGKQMICMCAQRDQLDNVGKICSGRPFHLRLILRIKRHVFIVLLLSVRALI